MTNALIYLFGYPGVGKNTIAQEIEKQSDLIAVQNHLVSNAFRHVMSKQGTGDKRRLDGAVRHHTMKAWVNLLDFIEGALPEQGLVFTSVLYDDPDRIEFYDYVRQWAGLTGRAFFPVRLNCSNDEIMRRAQSPGREAAFKLTDPDTLEHILASNDLLTPRSHAFLNLDITDWSARDTAANILRQLAAQLR